MADIEAFLQELTSGSGGHGRRLKLAGGTKREMRRFSAILQAVLPAVENAEKKEGQDEAIAAWLREVMDAMDIAYDITKRFELPAIQEGGGREGGGREGGGEQSGRGKNPSCILFYCSTHSESHYLDVPELASELKAVVKLLDLLCRKGGALGLPVASSSSRRLDIDWLARCVRLLKRISPMRCLRISPMRCREAHSEFESESVSERSKISRPSTPEFNWIRVNDESEHWLEELNDAAKLRISKLNNVSGGEEAARARLIQREYLETLELEWEWDHKWDGRPRGVDDEVLENLQPHANLKKLIIRDHCGSKFPSWMENQWLSKLENIELHSCQTWVFTPLGKLPFLKYLQIDGSPLGRHPHYGNISEWYRSLETLQSYSTQGWDGREGEEDEDSHSQLFPNLRILIINNCFNLERLPLLPPTLTELAMDHMYLTVLPGVGGSDGMSGGRELSSPSSLSSLHLSNIWRFTSLREGLLNYRLGALETLTIESCSWLESFPETGLRLLVSLKSLTIKDCEHLTWSPENGSCLPSSLVDLKIIRCRGICVDSFFAGMKTLKALSTLLIEGLDNFFGEQSHMLLESLPGELLCHLTALTELEIKNCPKLRILGFHALASLRRLKILSCYHLHSAPSYKGSGQIPLEYLEIEGSDLQFLTPEILQNLTSLQELRISGSSLDGEVVKSLCSLTSLQKLYMEFCSDLASLPDELDNLTNLEELCIIDCSLESLPQKTLPASLIILVIRNCNLPAERCIEGGQDWLKIAHIPYVEINRYKIKTEASKQL